MRVENEERKKAVDFEQDFKNGLSDYNTQTQELSKSYVYTVFAQSLKRLSNSKAAQKTITVFMRK